MSIERDAWSAFKSQIETDANLSAYVSTYYYGNKEKTFNQDAYPLLHINIDSVSEELDASYVAIPKKKQTHLIISIGCKVWNSNPEDLILASLELDELIRNAIEAILQLGGAANIVRTGDTIFAQLSDDAREGVIDIDIETPRFTAGSR